MKRTTIVSLMLAAAAMLVLASCAGTTSDKHMHRKDSTMGKCRSGGECGQMKGQCQGKKHAAKCTECTAEEKCAGCKAKHAEMTAPSTCSHCSADKQCGSCKAKDAQKAACPKCGELKGSEDCCKAPAANLCKKCGEVKGSENCCKAGAAKMTAPHSCSHCTPEKQCDHCKAKDAAAQACPKCGEVKGSENCCKPSDDTTGAVMPPANTVCPVMEGMPVNKDLYVDHNGRRVYFCCGGCIRTFKADPEKYLQKLDK